jgi:hypothetical protein
MTTSIPVRIPGPEPGTSQTLELKVQPASADDGTDVFVVALDADTGITIGTVNQGTSPWVVGQPPTSSSSFAITPGASSALETSHVLKASAGNLYSINVVTTTVSGYLMTFNAVSVPVDGAVTPIECVPVTSNSAASISFSGAPPDFYSTGIIAVFSTTGPFTKTSSATAFFKWRVQ